MKQKILILCAFALILQAHITNSQSKPVVATEKDAVIQEVQNQLTVMSGESGELTEFCTKNGVKGEFVMDLTIQGKGKLLTIYMVSSSVENVSYQNMLKNKLMELQFANIKLPKNERVKFRHTLTF
jgi:hypothetical protein